MGCVPERDGACLQAETPAHKVRMSSFEMAKYEVTQGLWESVMGENPSLHRQCGSSCPVEGVSWYDIQTFIQRLNANVRSV